MIVAIAWQLVGQELLLVAPQQLEERKQIGRFARTKAYDLALVEDIRAARTPTDEGERRDFCLQVLVEGKRLRIGEGMGEREAEYVASVVLDRIRPRARWSDEARAAPSVELQAPTPSRRAPGLAAGRASRICGRDRRRRRGCRLRRTSDCFRRQRRAARRRRIAAAAARVCVTR